MPNPWDEYAPLKKSTKASPATIPGSVFKRFGNDALGFNDKMMATLAAATPKSAPPAPKSFLERARDAVLQAAQSSTPSGGADPFSQLVSTPEGQTSAAKGSVAKSYARNMANMVTPLIHPIQTVKSIGDLGTGGVQKIMRANGLWKGPQSQGEKMLDAIGNDYATSYGTSAGLGKMLEDDPTRPLFDAGAVLSVPFGGEALESRLPATLARAAEAVRTGTNPIALAGKTLQTTGALSKAAQIIGRGGIGNLQDGLTPAALNAVQTATQGRIGPPDIAANPAFAQTLIDTMKAKGINPAAVREAILQHNGAPTLRSRVTGTPVAPEIAVAANDAASQGHQAIRDAVGTSPPSSTLGAALDEAVTNSHNNVSHLYNRAMSGPEIFKPAAAAVIGSEMDKALDAAGLSDFAKRPSVVQAKSGFEYAKDKLGTLAQGDQLDLSNLESIRQELNSLWATAKNPADYRALSAMKDGLDNGMAEAAKNGFLAHGDATSFVQNLQDARGAFAQHKMAFEQPGPIGTAVRQLDQKPGPNGLYVPSGDAGTYAKVQDTLLKNMLTNAGETKPGGLHLFDRLSDVLPDSEPLHDVLKQTIGQIDTQGAKGATLKTSPGSTQKFLDSDIGQQVYTPEEASALNLGSEGRRILDTKVPSSVANASLVANAMNAVKDIPGRMARGYLAGAPFGSGTTGAVVNTVLGAAREPLQSRKLLAREMGGAPSAFPVSDLTQRTGNVVQNISRPYGMEHAAQMGDQPEDSSLPPAHVDAVAPAASVPTAAKSIIPEAIDASPNPWDEYAPIPSASIAHDSAAVEAPSDEGGKPWEEYTAPPDKKGEHFGDDEIDPLPRASGGRTSSDIEHLVQALLSKARKAKHASNAVTKPLLGVHDDVIANALAVAQKSL